MDYRPFKNRLNRYVARYGGGASRPTFFDVATVSPALHAVTESYPRILAEWERLRAARLAMPRYHDIDPGEAAISAGGDPDRRWSVFMLYLLGHRPAANRALCPDTCAVLDRVPGLIQAFFSILDPGKSVPLHEGPCFGYLRYHLALHVPAENPPTLVVNGHEYVWRAGEAVLFDDAWPHEVINSASDIRVVLVVDVLRPLPAIPSLVNRLVTLCVAAPTYGRAVIRGLDAYAAGEVAIRSERKN